MAVLVSSFSESATHSEPVSRPEQDSQPVGQSVNQYAYLDPPPGPHQNIENRRDEDNRDTTGW